MTLRRGEQSFVCGRRVTFFDAQLVSESTKLSSYGDPAYQGSGRGTEHKNSNAP
jgi:hypothetical protein